MARSNYLVDRVLIVRQENGKHRGARFKADDGEIGDWIPCRLRKPEGDVERTSHTYQIQPDFDLHIAAYDLAGVRIKLRQSDTLRVYQRINNYWVEYDKPFIIVGAIQPKRRRTRLISYIVPVSRGVAPEF